MTLHFQDSTVTLYHGRALDIARELPDESVNCIVTSPPYFKLRDYGVEGQYGLEATPGEYVENQRILFAELWRVLAHDGTLWLNLGDSYAGSWGNQGHDPKRADLHTKCRDAEALPTRRRTGSSRPGMPAAKNLIGIPWRVALALQEDGWILRNDIVWSKPNAMPESVTDRLSSRYEHVFMFSKSSRYWFDLNPIKVPVKTQRGAALNWARESKEADVPGQGHHQHRADRTPYAPGMNPQNIKAANGSQHRLPSDHPGTRNPGDVWEIPTQPFAGSHFAVMPIALAERCILAGCRPNGTLLDPCSGIGTTGLVAQRTGRRYIGIDINRDYLDLSLRSRLHNAALDFDCEVTPPPLAQPRRPA